MGDDEDDKGLGFYVQVIQAQEDHDVTDQLAKTRTKQSCVEVSATVGCIIQNGPNKTCNPNTKATYA